MSLDDLKKTQDHARRQKEIESEIHRARRRFQDEGAPDICRKAEAFLATNGIEAKCDTCGKSSTPREVGRGPYDGMFYEYGRIEISNTSSGLFILPWKEFIGWFDKEKGAAKYLWCVYWDSGEGSAMDPIRRSGVELTTNGPGSPLPIDLSCYKIEVGLQYLHTATMLWTSAQDNERISQAIVRMLTGEKITGDIQPDPIASQKSSPCYIASCVFSPVAPEVEILREFRDEIILRTTVGRRLVAWYYRTAPRITPFIRASAILQTLLRTWIRALGPMIRWALTVSRDKVAQKRIAEG